MVKRAPTKKGRTEARTRYVGLVDGSVGVRGLNDVQAGFRAMDRELPKELRNVMRQIAEDVIGVAQQRMPHITGEAQRSLKPRATQRGAGIAFPEGGTPWRGEVGDYYPWLDFGGGRAGARGVTANPKLSGSARRHGRTATNTFGVKREVVAGGRYLYPAIAESKQDTLDAVAEAIEDVARYANFETRGF